MRSNINLKSTQLNLSINHVTHPLENPLIITSILLLPLSHNLPSPPSISEQIPIIRTQIPPFRFLVLSQAQIRRGRSIPLRILHAQADEIDDAGCRAQADEGDADAVAWFVARAIFGQEGVGCDDAREEEKTITEWLVSWIGMASWSELSGWRHTRRCYL